MHNLGEIQRLQAAATVSPQPLCKAVSKKVYTCEGEGGQAWITSNFGTNKRNAILRNLNGCHLWEYKGTWFPHTPHSGGFCGFFDEVEKNQNPTAKLWDDTRLRAFSAVRKQHTKQVKPVEV
jgi:hypothetical protein